MADITEKTSVSWPVLIALLAGALFVGGTLNVVNNLSTKQAALEADVITLKLARETDRGEVNTVKSNIDSMRSDLRDIKNSLQQLVNPQTRLAGGKQ